MALDGVGGPRGTQPLALGLWFAAPQQAPEGAKPTAPVGPTLPGDSNLVGEDATGLGAVAESQAPGSVGKVVAVVHGLATPQLQASAFPNHCMAAGFASMLEAHLGDEAYSQLGQSLLQDGHARLPNGTELKVSEHHRKLIVQGMQEGRAVDAAVQSAIQALGMQLDGSDHPVLGIRLDALGPLNEALGVDLRVATKMEEANVGDFVLLGKDGKAHLSQVAMVENGDVLTTDGAGNELRLEGGVFSRIFEIMSGQVVLVDESALPGMVASASVIVEGGVGNGGVVRIAGGRATRF